MIYIPQVHRNPGSNLSDPMNDTAVAAQNQIYSIVSYLVKDMGIKYVMAEGDMYGPVPDTTLKNMKMIMDARDNIANDIAAAGKNSPARDANPALAQKLIQEGTTAISAADRAITLQGGPYKLKAEGANFTLYGAETSSTYNESAGIVQNYLYLQDRMHALSSRNQSDASPLPRFFNANDLNAIQQQIATSRAKPSRWIETSPSADIPQTQNDPSAMFTDIETNIKMIQERLAPMPQIGRSPSRDTNPYASISDPAILQQEQTELTNEINTTVIGARNRDTAENFGKGLVAENTSIGVLQFGAGHEDGLVKELNNSGFSVIVVTANEVAKTPAADPSAQSNTPTAPTPRQQNAPALELELLKRIRQRMQNGNGSDQATL